MKSFAISYGRSHLDKGLIRKKCKVQPRGGASRLPRGDSLGCLLITSGKGTSLSYMMVMRQKLHQVSSEVRCDCRVVGMVYFPSLAPGPSLSARTVAILTYNTGKHQSPLPQPFRLYHLPQFPLHLLFSFSPVLSFVWLALDLS